MTSRVVGVDINPQYLQQLAVRFPHPAFAVELHCADLSAHTLEPEAFDLIHAALVLEYVEWLRVFPRVVDALQPEGVLSMVLQLPSQTSPAVTSTRFTSLRSLEAVFRFVDPDALMTAAAALGLRLDTRRTERLESGKAFEVLHFSKPPQSLRR